MSNSRNHSTADNQALQVQPKNGYPLFAIKQRLSYSNLFAGKAKKPTVLDNSAVVPVTMKAASDFTAQIYRAGFNDALRIGPTARRAFKELDRKVARQVRKTYSQEQLAQLPLKDMAAFYFQSYVATYNTMQQERLPNSVRKTVEHMASTSGIALAAFRQNEPISVTIVQEPFLARTREVLEGSGSSNRPSTLFEATLPDMVSHVLRVDEKDFKDHCKQQKNKSLENIIK